MSFEPTPSTHQLPFRPADFDTLTAALDYAARGDTGLNFYAGGQRGSVLSYRQLRDEARDYARRLLGMGLQRGDRVALVAETDPCFVRFFFACQYAGLIPVPMPATVKLGGHSALVEQLRGMLDASGARLAVASEVFVPFLSEAAAGLDTEVLRPALFAGQSQAGDERLPEVSATDIAFIQYTSGSTRFPKGVMVSHRGAMSNLEGIARHGVCVVPGDRCMSWLPFYHDMGLVGFLLVPMASQLSVDYMATHEFAMRPTQWLRLISANRATISFSPCFGFELCARRLRPREMDRYHLSQWRVAGVGAEMIRPRSLDLFAEKLAPSGFSAGAFLPCYGMAECTLGVSFASPGKGYHTDTVNLDALYEHRRVDLVGDNPDEAASTRQFVNCGRPLPGYEVEVRDDSGRPLGDYRTGAVFLRGPSVMEGYFGLPDETRETISDDGWLCTGDIGYMAGGTLTITGRQKDLIIINGRNIWPQDIEHLCETQEEIRVGDAVAFSVPSEEEGERCVVLVQCRDTDTLRRRLLRPELGLDCEVELVPARSLPVTSSGKRSRSRARQNYLASQSSGPLANIGDQPLKRAGVTA